MKEPFPSERPPGAPVDPWTAFATAPERPPGVFRRAGRAFLRSFVHEYALAIYAGLLLAVGLTWPTLRYPLHTLPEDLGDPARQAWQISWIGHILLTHPQQLWQSNAFYPEPNSFAFGDSLLGYAPVGMLGDSPLAATLRYNILFVLAHALLAIGGYALVRQLGAGRTGAAVAAVAIAYAPWRLAQAGHLDIISAGGIPLALAMLARGHGWSLRRGLRAGERNAGWAAFGWLFAAWQVSLGFSLGLPFLGVLGLILLIVLVGTPILWFRRRTRRRAYQSALPASGQLSPGQAGDGRPRESQALTPLPAGSQPSPNQSAPDPTGGLPITAQPIPSRPLPGQPAPGQPVASQPVTGQPIPGQPVASQPVTGQPAPTQPVASQRAGGLPSPGQSHPRQPLAGELAASHGVSGQPTPDQPSAAERSQSQLHPDQPLAGQAAPSQQASGQPAPDQSNSGQPNPGQPNLEQPSEGMAPDGQAIPGKPAAGPAAEGKQTGEPSAGIHGLSDPQGGGRPVGDAAVPSEPWLGQPVMRQPPNDHPLNRQDPAAQSHDAQPREGQPLDGRPAADDLADGRPIADPPTTGQAVAGPADADPPIAGQSTASQSRPIQTAAGQPLAGQSDVDRRAGQGQPLASQSDVDRPAAGQLFGSQIGAARSVAGQPATNQPAVGQPVGGQPANQLANDPLWQGQASDAGAGQGQVAGAGHEGGHAVAEQPVSDNVGGRLPAHRRVDEGAVARRWRRRRRGVAVRESDFDPVLGWRLLIIDVLGPLILAGIAALIALPYFHLADKSNSTAQIKFFSPPLRSLLIGPAESRIWGGPHEVARSALGWPAEMSLLPGFVLYALALAGLGFSIWTLRQRLLLMVALAGSVILTLGTNFFGGRWTYLPLFGHLPASLDVRIPGRMMLWVTLLLGILAAGAVAEFVRRAEHWSAQRIPPWPAWWLRLATLVPLMLVIAEGWNTTAHPVVPAQPASMRTITSPMLVLPTGAVTDGTVMLWSTTRYQKIANGSGGFDATRQAQMRAAVASFPDAASIQYLRSINVTTVLLIRSAVAGTPWERAGDTPVDSLGITREDATDAVIFHLK